MLNASRPGKAVEGCPVDCSLEQTFTQPNLRILSLNIFHGFPSCPELRTRLDQIAHEAERFGVDILLLQEIPWTVHFGNSAKYLADRLGMNYLYLRANGNRNAILFEEGVAILSRFQILESRFTELQPRAGIFEHRVVLGARLSIGPQSFWVYSTHLTHGEPEVNQSQAAVLKDFITASSPGAGLLGGDFNAEQASPQMIGLSQMWTDTYRALHPNSEGFTCCLSDLRNGAREEFNKRIDYMFLIHPSELVKLKKVDLIFTDPVAWDGSWIWVSDHAGLLLELTWDL